MPQTAVPMRGAGVPVRWSCRFETTGPQHPSLTVTSGKWMPLRLPCRANTFSKNDRMATHLWAKDSTQQGHVQVKAERRPARGRTGRVSAAVVLDEHSSGAG